MLLCGRATRVITQNKNTFIHQPDDGEEQKEEEGRGRRGVGECLPLPPPIIASFTDVIYVWFVYVPPGHAQTRPFQRR